MLVLAEDLGLIESRQNLSHFLIFRGQLHGHCLDVGDVGCPLKQLLHKLAVHPTALDFELQGGEIEATGEQLLPLPIPVAKLLQSLPLALVVADQFRVDHDLVPIIEYGDLRERQFFEICEDLDGRGVTNFMILMPTLWKATAVKPGSRVLMSSSACSALKRF